MKYSLEDFNELGLGIEIQNNDEFIEITIKDDYNSMNICLDSKDLYDLIGVLCHIQKQLKKI